ncbi:MAG: phosphoribosyltransferase [Deltaproteobacteria bacterium]|nr:phosphoribosyltransferase [Deltaproteobacteria bacterium]
MFYDRKDAGNKLAAALKEYKDKNVLILAIPKGGIEVALEVAKYLNADFSLAIVRKLPFPDEPEGGFGAIAEDGSIYINREASRYLDNETIKRIVDEQKNEIKRRISVLRNGKPLPELKDRTVILIDDGIAAGSSMRAAIMLLRNNEVKKIIVASPVAGEEIVFKLKKLADKIVILEMPQFFRAVAQVYQNWYDVSDKEALELIERFKNNDEMK